MKFQQPQRDIEMGFVIEPGNGPGPKCKKTGEHEYWEEYTQPGFSTCMHCGKLETKISTKERLNKLDAIIKK